MMFFAAILPAFLLTSAVSGAPIRRQAANNTDVLVFQFAGVLEQLEDSFYSQALAKFQDSDFTAAGFGNTAIPKELFSTIQGDEAAHTSIIDSTLTSLGAKPVTGCKFDFTAALKDVATMAATARVLENVGVSAYLGGANLLSNKELLVAAASILTIEARHQTMLNVLNTATSIPAAFDTALSPSQVLALASPFISGCDLGIPANPVLSITNTGAAVPGTKLTFQSTGIPSGVDTSTLTCQMMTGGAAFALALPFDNCVVPNINGPVYIFVVNGTQPLLNSQVNQATGTILAGPTLAFIDSVPETIGQVVKAAPSAVASTTTISGAEATGLLNAADPAGQSLAPSATSDASTATATSSAAESTSTGAGPITVLGWSNSTGSSDSTSASSSY
ncbi:hypothetical protein FRC04_001323 [Tulasnella sp. 424]|nr:hypothetical protein FRC04_001323 [Tulasnella sp. 424]KAG8966783.1 hypothetical protein FRC05_002419 [Tulasnella sp. 425]